ncbi:hypothetical protein EOK75_08310 [Pseudorhodobacter turbinis]|uniref:Uncharacterized protein n=1 Tax=Pseudorhodobacter turbinis TaxID=2500533 RepID=A0A4P8EGA4_9RHOB|nr:hypothetical protein [Pseudorhodobacter turbinis]QCO55743.1 hypothetical protein EOK75_08310 [Pseudorhodobacter turbinis]
MTVVQAIAAEDSIAADQGSGALHLLLPTNLPTEITLTPEDRVAMRDAVTRFLTVLQSQDPAAGIAEILQGLATGKPYKAVPVGSVGIPAQVSEVEDFDAYFNVRRIAPEHPAHALLVGLLQTSAAAFALAARDTRMPRDLLGHQAKGFAAYARLLGRICGIDGLS